MRVIGLAFLTLFCLTIVASSIDTAWAWGKGRTGSQQSLCGKNNSRCK
jgi:hypothetical protein